MTYCLAIRVDQGLVFGSDSRTNAGVDYVTTYRKMHVFQPAADRLFVVLSAGNLATTQAVVNQIRSDLDYPPTDAPNLTSVRYLFEAADYLGQVNLAMQQRHALALKATGVSGDVSLILGGQIRGEAPEIYLIYPQGNHITASDDTPYLQIGESKYGKPNLYRLIEPGLTLETAGRIALTSLDATWRSNVTVGPPFEIALYSRDTLAIGHGIRVADNSEYLSSLRDAWTQGLRRTLQELPPFEWEGA